MEYRIEKVADKKQIKDFVKLPGKLYKGIGSYVPDLNADVLATLNLEHNKGMEHISLQPFVAYDEQNNVVGRVIAIVNRKANSTWDTKNVRFSMIEFTDDINLSRQLLQAVEDWGKERGMERIVGPLGATDFDKEGMQISDFEEDGSMVTIYNPEYYPAHMEQLGFEKEVDWLQVKIVIPEQVPARYQRVAKLVREMYELKVRTITKKELLKEGYGRKIFDLFNEAYAPLYGFSKLSPEQQDAFLYQYAPLLDYRIMPVIEDKDGNLIGVAVTIGGLNKALKKSKGKMMPLGWLHLMKALKWKHEDKIEMLLVAVRPDMQGLGVNALFFDYLIPVYNKLGYKWAEVGPQLESNLKVLSQWKPLNPIIYKRRRCWGKNIK